MNTEVQTKEQRYENAKYLLTQLISKPSDSDLVERAIKEYNEASKELEAKEKKCLDYLLLC